MNLNVLKKSRKTPKPGDIFVFQVEPDMFRFGRVIRTDARCGPIQGCILIYLYSTMSDDKHSIPDLNRDELLIPPILTATKPWTEGVFETVVNRQLETSDVLPIHCFEHGKGRGEYYDADNNELAGPIEPVGRYALGNHRAIDQEISKALGFPIHET